MMTEYSDATVPGEETGAPKAAPDPGETAEQRFELPAGMTAEMLEAFGNLMKEMTMKEMTGGHGSAGPSASGNTSQRITLDPSAAGPLPEMVLNLFSAAIEQTKAASSSDPAANQKEATSSTAGEANPRQEQVRRAPRAPTEAEQKIQEAFRTAFAEYIRTNVTTDGQTEVNVDQEFLLAHGPGLVGSVLHSVTSAILPEKIEMTIPTGVTPSGETAKPAQVRLKIDLAGMLQGLMPKGVAGEATEDEREPEERESGERS